MLLKLKLYIIGYSLFLFLYAGLAIGADVEDSAIDRVYAVCSSAIKHPQVCIGYPKTEVIGIQGKRVYKNIGWYRAGLLLAMLHKTCGYVNGAGHSTSLLPFDTSTISCNDRRHLGLAETPIGRALIRSSALSATGQCEGDGTTDPFINNLLNHLSKNNETCGFVQHYGEAHHMRDGYTTIFCQTHLGFRPAGDGGMQAGGVMEYQHPHKFPHIVVADPAEVWYKDDTTHQSWMTFTVQIDLGQGEMYVVGKNHTRDEPHSSSIKHQEVEKPTEMTVEVDESRDVTGIIQYWVDLIYTRPDNTTYLTKHINKQPIREKAMLTLKGWEIDEDRQVASPIVDVHWNSYYRDLANKTNPVKTDYTLMLRQYEYTPNPEPWIVINENPFLCKREVKWLTNEKIQVPHDSTASQRIIRKYREEKSRLVLSMGCRVYDLWASGCNYFSPTDWYQLMPCEVEHRTMYDTNKHNATNERKSLYLSKEPIPITDIPQGNIRKRVNFESAPLQNNHF